VCVLSGERTRHCMGSPARLPAERLRSALCRTAAAGPPLPWRPPGSKTAHLPALLPSPLVLRSARRRARAHRSAAARAVHAHPRPRPVQLAARAHRDGRGGARPPCTGPSHAALEHARAQPAGAAALMCMRVRCGGPAVGEAGRARACACMRRAMPQRSRAWREAGRGAERAQRARCDLCRGRRSKTGTRRSASCTRSTGWLGARCSSRSWPTSTPPPSALAWRRAPARAPPGPLDERRCRRARSRRAGRADSSAPVLRRPGLSFAVEAVPGTLAAAARRRCVAMGHRLRSSATLFSACMAARRRRARAEAPPRARQGCEALIPGMKALIDRSAESGVESICIGMPHRGARPRRRAGAGAGAAAHALATMPV